MKGADTIKFIQKDQVPNEQMKDVTYGSFSYDFKPNKEEKECTRLTAGGDQINYPDDCGTTSKADAGNDEESQAAVRLLRYTRGSNNNLQREQNDVDSPQQRRVLQQKECTK